MKKEKFDFDKALKQIKNLIKKQYRKDAEFRINVLLSQLGDISRHITHDQKLCPPVRPYGTKKDEEDAFGHTLLHLLMAAMIRKVNIKSGLENAIKSLEDNEWVKRERKHKKGFVKGVVAHPGEIVGVAFVDPEANKLHNLNGHILIVEHIRPDVSIYIKKAKGIVTNQGGRFCHAAIMAREYNIPCIVGTGNATEIINHGQKIKIEAKPKKKGLVHLNIK